MLCIPGAPSTLLRYGGGGGTAALHWLVLKPLNQLSDADRQELLSFLEANPQLARGHQLKESFRQIVAQGDLEGLDGWREQAASSGLRPFQSLAWGFGKDYQAIQLALTTRWSNAQCEGQICRVEVNQAPGLRGEPSWTCCDTVYFIAG